MIPVKNAGAGFALLATCVLLSEAYRYDPRYVQHNLNQNKTAVNPLDYSGEWTGHQYTPSPDNWRFPFYTIFLDRFVNGDPTNDNINHTAFEHDHNSNQMRHGGDLQGLVDTLDYIHGMGVRGLYIAGSPFINQPWGYDQYSPLDLSILEPHFGTLDVWRSAIDEIHTRNMYVILDSTFATMGDLIGFEGYLNSSSPFTLKEHQVQWKTDRHYWDFEFGNSYNKTCDYPPFWSDNGFPVDKPVTDQMVGCYDSEFDQYGDTEAFGVFPDWRRELSKFGSAQDRLREWHPPVRVKLENFYCLLISQLDVDGFRYDKATQSTVDAMGFMNDVMRTCAKRYGKENFFLPGEITGGNDFGAIFLGRGRQPDQRPDNVTQAVNLTSSDNEYFLRERKYGALDSAAFHYTVYRALTRFLGMDGNLQAAFDAPNNWVEQWNTYLLTNDFLNTNTGAFDPRHMYGVTNQDVFRWPAITHGVERQLLGHFITSLLLPGIPLLLWGEEQAFYVLDNTASNYIYGRQAMSSATAWQTHGCYHLTSTNYYKMPLESAKYGCSDNTVSYDHRDPSAPVRNIIRHMMELREAFPVLTDGFFLQQLSNLTDDVYYPGSSDVPTETGMWSILRSGLPNQQDLTGHGAGDGTADGGAMIWLVYSNLNRTRTWQFDCMNNDTQFQTTALISPYASGITVRNLFYPFDEHTLEDSTRSLGLDGSTEPNGCLSSLEMAAYDFRAYVPINDWVAPTPMITKFSPGHDARMLSKVDPSGTEGVDVELQFSVAMDCDSVTNSLSFNSTTDSGSHPSVDQNSIKCGTLGTVANSTLVGTIPSKWSWQARLTDVANGIHSLTFRNASAANGAGSTNTIDRFLFRVGQSDNPMVFPRTANYSTTLLSKSESGSLQLHQSAAGADLFRYSTNFGSSYSDWMPYQGGVREIEKQPWSGTSLQAWSGEHVRVQYFSRLGGTSDHVQEADMDSKKRRFPHMFLNGPYNQYGYDAGLNNKITLTDDYTWTHHWMLEWSKNGSGSVAQINVWGIDPDGQPDLSLVMGDADGDSILDRLPPSSLAAVVLNVTSAPPKPYLSWKFVINDGDLRFKLVPAGSMWTQLILYILLWFLPLITASFSCWAFMRSFYKVKFNQVGIAPKVGLIPTSIKRHFQRTSAEDGSDEKAGFLSLLKHKSGNFLQKSDVLNTPRRRQTVLIATMEYDIEDWAIRIKIGGLGVMAQLMGKNLGHQDLIWVVPCVDGVEYPEDEKADPMAATILGVTYEVNVQYHKLRNITYILLDAPIFRQQTKSEPYPARMDDLTSAIYYSAWNQCIAQAIKRFPIDLYHINDYHGTVAPLYLLPSSIPICLSLHNAEFQGLWPMRNKKEREEVSSVFNLPPDVVEEYVQFGEIFNLLHAGASYLRIHQQGFGAVGVSKKYGKRSYARYPIFWGLKKIQALPNPDPSDTGEWDKQLPREEDIYVDDAFEVERLELRTQAQEWAGLEKNAKAELFVFVGRWSMQKGIDLIADTFPAILESNPNVQLITVGPVIDLYGKFAALKLDRLMKMYPTRVCSKPVFTALPPYIFSGAEFALIPSRDEPFGLVAVEFGRKGALGVGARVGGLGQMPGWWYTVESTTTAHLLKQFKKAIRDAMSCPTETKAMMRARSAKQRFPVAQWVEDLTILQSTSRRIHDKVYSEKSHSASGSVSISAPIVNSPPGNRTEPSNGLEIVMPQMSHMPVSIPTELNPPNVGSGVSGLHSRDRSQYPSHRQQPGLTRKASLGSRRGPGHVRTEDLNDGGAEQGLRGGQNLLPPIADGELLGVGTAIFMFSSHDDNDEDDGDDDSSVCSQGDVEHHVTKPSKPRPRLNRGPSTFGDGDLPWPLQSPQHDTPSLSSTPSQPGTPDVLTGLFPPPRIFSDGVLSPNRSMLSVNSVVGESTEFNLQKVDPFFTDSNGAFYHAFEKKLQTLDGKNSETINCIEEYLVKSEKAWFNAFRNAKLGRLRTQPNSARSSFAAYPDSARPGTADHAPRFPNPFEMNSYRDDDAKPLADEFLLGTDYKPPTGIRKWMQIRVGDWPLYAFFIALGQIMAANSYQITLLTGVVGETASRLYVVASIYLITSMCWWYLFRRFASVVSLSLPFFFYGLAFLLIGLAHYGSPSGRGWIQNVATGFYALASSSGALFFSLNFGDEGGAMVKAWTFRACVIQGTQQIYVVALWSWGSVLGKKTSRGIVTANDSVAGTWKITAITFPIAIALWAVGITMWLGLPTYYRQAPGTMPTFYTSVVRRKVVLWFFVTAIVQNFFLSAPYGRNWLFLFSSEAAKPWQVLLLVVLFFIGVWAGLLGIFAHLSKSHSWILPLFAIGLLAPRWAQIWWGTSNVGLWLPWAGGPVVGALASRALWLWLGVLDAIQGVGLGMIMLGTLTRIHVAFTITAAQVLGSIATMVARAAAPNKLGPGPISPDITGGVGTIWQAWFWVALTANLLLCVGFYKFYRKEQLQKP
ncbi:Cell wall alpha-1,3-glucan synthase ags1 [Recurvomyces mirabilis]|uniref:alpha-1,3-glucan synthase n=1 Tax=Recurvomyces mirabilis TaxID=574656 RepID=A0AAE0TMT7_9PEZI|nr:Cell wall alpha-1,3-glucan synthase ags1 [Recurvomyces mirabilis]KAK5150070.1 Cell wall alpha-1,3-glucan synthase ags1 [Recurvomyces mirabilis]